jgi:hypothetical protein
VLQNRLAVELRDGAAARASELPAAQRPGFLEAFASSDGLEVGAGQSGARFGPGTPESVVHLAAESFAMPSSTRFARPWRWRRSCSRWPRAVP